MSLGARVGEGIATMADVIERIESGELDYEVNGRNSDGTEWRELLRLARLGRAAERAFNTGASTCSQVNCDIERQYRESSPLCKMCNWQDFCRERGGNNADG
jgi:hypothetical protein